MTENAGKEVSGTTAGCFKPFIIVAAVVLAYGNSLNCEFQFSDYNVIVNNPAVQSWGGWLESVRHLGIRPLLKFTYTLCWTSGLGVVAFHLFNIAVHAANSLLVYLLAERFAQRRNLLQGKGVAANSALFAALLFALHPVQTEAVTYISGRSSSLSALFFLASLYAYARGTETRGRMWLYLLSPLLFVAAVAAKEVAVALPLALLLWELGPAARRWKEVLADQALHWALLLILLLLIFSHPKYLSLLLFSSELRGLTENLINQINGFSYLLSRLILLHGLNIDPDLAVVSSMTPAMWGKLALMSAALGMALLWRRSRPWLLFGTLWFLVVLMPSNSVFARLDLVNERHLYLADFGIFLMLGCELALLCQRGERWRRPLAAGTAMLLSLLLVATATRNRDYRSEVALWESTVRNSPDKARAYNNLGCAYELAARPVQAAAAYRRALRLDPWHRNAAANLARLKAAGEGMRRVMLRGPESEWRSAPTGKDRDH